MARILISHPIAENTIQKLGLNKIRSSFNFNGTDIYSLTEDVFYTDNAGEEIFYIPSIASKQSADETHDPTLETLRHALEIFQPNVLIVGNNTVNRAAIIAWRQAVGDTKKLQIIRRGVDTRAIDKTTAQKYNIIVDNLPGLNSPYVAQHMSKYLNLKNAQSNSKIAIIGVGNIGKEIAIKAIDYDLEVHLFSPSLQIPRLRLSTLLNRGIPSEKVVCAPSIEQALIKASYVAIAVPWENSQGGNNAGMIEEKHILSLTPNAGIVSASVPGIFSDQALSLMNELMWQKKIYVRIDTPKRHVETIKQHYPYLDAAHDEAFAALECQQMLDEAMLRKARAFLQKSAVASQLIYLEK
ncbi:Rossmann-fold NAD(P)-binding domain-containing protein [Planktothrix mougeotii]|uniref:Phosphoglycerate dehydrogenase n=1 Tax=Planktothrix mougeotii LEGE 06226 TaxID=1828728 RepID=A0ABR9UKT8_9CYAN|nr:phosphoglycerate dehydrogenase [Planktothrix mougeotii]MBE9146159.1 phosphoglycerate dehydrogenase [Planktothrix mougeotii LEGE 06226]